MDSISKASYKLPTQNPIFAHHNKPFYRSLVSVYTFGRTTEGKRWEAARFIQRILRNSMVAHTLGWYEMQLDFDETGGLTEWFLEELWMSRAIRKIRELVPIVKQVASIYVAVISLTLKAMLQGYQNRKPENRRQLQAHRKDH